MDDGTADEQGKGIKAIQRAFDIIEIINRRGPVRATAIAEQLHCSQSTIHYHLKTLQNCGYVVFGDHGYSLGIRFLHLGGQALVSGDLYRALHNEVAALAIEVGESVQVAVEEYGHGYYVEHVSGDSGSRTSRHIGTEMELHSTAAGKAILAGLSPEQLNELLDRQGLTQFTDDTVTDRSALVDELTQIQEHGVAYEIREYLPDETGVAVPLRQDDETIGALELTLPPTRIPDPRTRSKAERFPSELVDRVEESARNIEANLED